MGCLNLITPTKSLSEVIIELGKYVAALESENDKLKQDKFETENEDKDQRILNAMPDILTAQNIADYLHISRNKAYSLLKQSPEYGGIKSFKQGRSVRCKKFEFKIWLEKQT